MKSSRHKYEKIVYYTYEPTEDNKAHASPILMIHGHGGDHRGLEALARELNRYIVIPDLPGFGESEEIENHSIENYVKSLKALVTNLELSSYVAVGHSLGSAVALSLARSDSRMDLLVLINPVPEFSDTLRSLVQKVNAVGNKIPTKYADALVKAHLYNLATFLMHSRKRTDPRQAKKYLTEQKQAKYSFKTWSESGDSIYRLNQMEIAKQITIPTLVMHADSDTLTSLEDIRTYTGLFADASLAHVAKAGHFLPLEQPTTTANIINIFLDKHRV